MTLENWTNGIQILSSLILAGFTIALWGATNAQKNIAKKQHDTEIYKLRLEYINKLATIWLICNSYILKDKALIKPFLAQRENSDRYRDYCTAIIELESWVITSQYIFTQEIKVVGENLLISIKNLHEKMNNFDKDIQAEYLICENYYNEIISLISKYTEKDSNE